MIRIGVDFGGTKIEAAALAPDGAWLARRRIANPKSYDAAVAAVAELVARMEAEAGAAGTVGVGAPGSVSPATGAMRNANSTWLNGRAFREDLEAALGRPIRLANDADCLALSEAADGAAAGARSAFAVIIGTGCGGGVAVDGRLLHGPSGVAGEWGHTPLPWPRGDEYPGPTCWCGLSGCLETWVSGSGFARDYAQIGGAPLAAEAIVAAARAGDPAAGACLERWLDRLGRGLAVIADILDPEVIVFGGGMSLVGELYDALPARIAPYVFGGHWGGRAAPARWGDASGVRGAARLWDA
jgi:fructokinase